MTAGGHSASRVLRSAICAAAVWLVAGAALAQTVPPPPDGAIVAVNAPPATVEVWNRSIVTLRASIGSSTPADRAERAARRIEAIPDEELGELPRVVSARVGNLDGLMAVAGARTLFGLLPEDVDHESGETLQSLGAETEQHLRAVFAAREQQRSLPLLLRGIAWSAAATVAFALVVWALIRGQRRVHARLTAAADRRSGAALRQVRGYLVVVWRRLAQVGAWALGLVALDLWLTFVLSQFPYTAPWGEALGSRLSSVVRELAQGAAHAAPGLLAVALIFVAARFIVRLLHALFDGVERGALTLPFLQPETAEATRRISTLLVWLFAVTVAYPYIPGSQTDAFRGVSVFVGLMLSLGSAGLVNQVMSGLVVVYARAIRPGEYVRIGEIEGVVSEVGLLSTKLCTARKEEVTIPNAVLVGSATTNYSRLADADGAVVTTSVTIGYDAPWRQVEALLLLAAERTPQVRRQPAPRVVQRKLDDFYVDYLLLVNVDRAEQRPAILSALHAQIQDAFNEFGVQIMSPHFETQPSEAVTVPKANWFTRPAKDPGS
ncbi:MAG: mechanosensitive ion channel [Deltaproteobacteria bacterium]|nr:mechanosensitive ion channel [Deltaproteobacteria bacterium]